MQPATRGVVLLHGHGRRGASLGRLAHAAARQGYATLVPRYRYRRSMRAILDEVAPRVEAFAARIERPVHFVTHSLGGLVARGLIARGASSTGRLVMLGPPNGGSEWADLLLAIRLDRLVLGAIGAHLRTTRAPADEALLGTSTTGIGIIAGTRALDPLLPRLLLPGPNDGKVTVAATRLKGGRPSRTAGEPHVDGVRSRGRSADDVVPGAWLLRSEREGTGWTMISPDDIDAPCGRSWTSRATT